MKRLDKDGHEIPDPRPVAIPAGFKRPETLAEQVQRLVRTHISRQAQEQGQETFEESEDFDVDEDLDPSSPFETFFDPVLGKDLSVQEFKQHEAAYRERYLKAQADYFATQDRLEVLRQPRRKAAAEPAAASVSPSPAPPPKDGQ